MYCFVVLLFSLAVVSCSLFLASRPVSPPPRIMFPLADVCTPCLYCPASRNGFSARRIQRLSYVTIRRPSGLSYCALPSLAFSFSGTPFTPAASCRKRIGHNANRVDAELVNSELRDVPSTAWVPVTTRLARRQTGGLESVATQSLPHM